jgi:hypothetical protein
MPVKMYKICEVANINLISKLVPLWVHPQFTSSNSENRHYNERIMWLRNNTIRYFVITLSFEISFCTVQINVWWWSKWFKQWMDIIWWFIILNTSLNHLNSRLLSLWGNNFYLCHLRHTDGDFLSSTCNKLLSQQIDLLEKWTILELFLTTPSIPSIVDNMWVDSLT